MREAVAVPEPPHEQHVDRTASRLSSGVSHHPSVLADGGVGLQSAVSSVPTDQDSMLRVSVGFETTDVPLPGTACSSAVSADVLSSSDICPPPPEKLDGESAALPRAVVCEPLKDVVTSPVCVSASQGATANLSHLTPNTSLGFVQATPSRALPSPTVNTREALGEVLIQRPFCCNNCSALQGRSSDPS